MKAYVFPVLILQLATAGVAQDDAPLVKEDAGENLFYAELALDAYSAYVWRGLVLTDEPVWQPGATLGMSLFGYGKGYGSVWSSFDATRRNRQTAFGGLGEMDYTAGYEVDLDGLTLGAGHIWYTYPKANGPDYAHSTREAFVALAYNNAYAVPFAEVYYDYAIAEGIYATVGLCKEVEVADGFTVGAEMSVGGGSDGYMECQFDGANGKMWLIDGNAALRASYALTDSITIGARIAWMSLFDDRLKGASRRDAILWGGINLSVMF
ncbi:MAG: hypothetical protein FWG50_06825 [Kiritimatiellaeota bacterium]|nr:hypothetical protein [Kiritimatiellota bacterium]